MATARRIAPPRFFDGQGGADLGKLASRQKGFSFAVRIPLDAASRIVGSQLARNCERQNAAEQANGPCRSTLAALDDRTAAKLGLDVGCGLAGGYISQELLDIGTCDFPNPLFPTVGLDMPFNSAAVRAECAGLNGNEILKHWPLCPVQNERSEYEVARDLTDTDEHHETPPRLAQHARYHGERIADDGEPTRQATICHSDDTRWRRGRAQAASPGTRHGPESARCLAPKTN